MNEFLNNLLLFLIKVYCCRQKCTQFGTEYILDLRIFVFSLILGYGFVDFESAACAEGAVKGLQLKGIQAQMAKVGIWMLHRPAIVRLFACK